MPGRSNSARQAHPMAQPANGKRPRFRSEQNGQPFCTYCNSSKSGNPFGHMKQSCPKIANLAPCVLCGAAGKLNHTIGHCPKNKQLLVLKDSEEVAKQRLKAIKERFMESIPMNAETWYYFNEKPDA
ncbi:unnamed protein product, partial [Mesorhabditis spiculigera]